MKIKPFIFFPIVALIFLSAFIQPSGKITVYTIGDSTMANKDTTNGNPERGWAQVLQQFFDVDRVVVENHAVNGRSSKSFFDEGRWKPIVDKLTPGDYVFIQFGHNDEKSEDPKRYTDPNGSYRNFLTMYVNDVRAKGACPVLMTPIARRKFSSGSPLPLDTHGEYTAAVRELALQLDVPMIDMAERTGRHLLSIGPDESKRLYMWLQPGQSSKYPDGLQDDTHLNELGAFRYAQMAVGGIRELNLPLAGYLKRSIYDLRWSTVALNQPDDWYGTNEAVAVAENVLLYQRNTGGWPKNIPMHQKLSAIDKKTILAAKDKTNDSTMDNDATYMEPVFLAKMYNKTHNVKYKDAFMKALQYILAAQYSNGGWPQYYPNPRGYFARITYNDNCMVNMMSILKGIMERDPLFTFVDDPEMIRRCVDAFDRGVDCILKTQYRQNGKLTGWCAQHDEKTLEPAPARSYELPSLSGSEGADLVLFLMEIKNPKPELKQAIAAAVEWFEQVKINGIKIETFVGSDGLRDRRVVLDTSAPPIWARFYQLDDNRPFFSDRDGIKKYAMSEIGHERRNGYSWYTYDPQKALDQYKKYIKNQNDTIIVARDGTGDYRNLQEAFDQISAFRHEPTVIFIKKGVYKEKLVLHSWLQNMTLIGEDRDQTIITWDDHAKINNMGTFRTYSLLIQGNTITFENLTVENNAAQLGQAVAVHVEGDKIIFRNCRLLGNQDTLYTGHEGSRQYFVNCYIEGTTDFIFGPSTCWFEACTIFCKKNSYITAASTPQNQEYGYIFNHCKITLSDSVDKMYLGRPWRPYAMTLLMNCEIPQGVHPEGWHNWGKEENEKTARYMEYNNKGDGASKVKRVKWAKILTSKEAEKYTLANVMKGCDGWTPNESSNH